MPRFVTGKELEDAVYDIIFHAKRQLYIISPFIKLDDYFRREVFNKHIANADLHIAIVFGKNETDIKRSLKMEDFDYFRQFPNISIVYVPNLHAKYYGNEKSGVVSSINLYDYSFKNNIEFGVVGSPNVLGKSETFDNEAFKAAQDIIEKNQAVFIRRPRFKKKLLRKNYLGSEDEIDYIKELVNGRRFPQINMFDHLDEKLVQIHQNKQRVSREEFEEAQKSTVKFASDKPDEKNSDQRKEVLAKKSTQDQGSCIRCGTEIRLDIDAPYCYDCFKVWAEYGNDEYQENYCHSCGKSENASRIKPTCYSCFKKNGRQTPNIYV